MKEKKRNHDRSKDQTILGVTMTKELKEKIKRAAALEHRNMANFAVHYLTKAVQECEKLGEPHRGPSMVTDDDDQQWASQA